MSGLAHLPDPGESLLPEGGGQPWHPTARKVYLGSLAVACAWVIYLISRVDAWPWTCFVFLLLCLWDVAEDQRPVTWSHWLPRGFVMLTIPYLLYRFAPAFWERALGWQETYVHWIWNWNDAFAAIPFNDAAIFRLWQPAWLTLLMRWSYSFGFAMIVWIAVIRSFFARDGYKALRYILSAHTLQLPLIVSFYNTVLLQEVWYVLGHSDGMARGWTSVAEMVTTVRNCFPSMHVSIAFAIMLLAWREKGRRFRWLMQFYGGSIIFATMYLEIHWILDVIAGMVLGWLTVRQTDWLLARLWRAPVAAHNPAANVV